MRKAELKVEVEEDEVELHVVSEYVVVLKRAGRDSARNVGGGDREREEREK